MTPRRPTRSLLAAAVLLVGGCYDAAAMIERARNDAIQSRLEEVNLGEFHVTLPRDESNSETTELFVEVYGRAVRYRIDKIESKLEEHDFSYRQSVLLALRGLTNQDLADPGLTKLREQLFTAANAVLTDTPVEKVGIAYIRLVRH